MRNQIRIGEAVRDELRKPGKLPVSCTMFRTIFKGQGIDPSSIDSFFAHHSQTLTGENNCISFAFHASFMFPCHPRMWQAKKPTIEGGNMSQEQSSKNQKCAMAGCHCSNNSFAG